MASPAARTKNLAEEKKIKDAAKKKAGAKAGPESDTAALLGGGAKSNGGAAKMGMLKSKLGTATKATTVSAVAMRNTLRIRSSPFTNPRSKKEQERLDRALGDITLVLQEAAALKLKDAGVGLDALNDYRGQTIRKNYLAAVEACQEFLAEDTKYDGSELDLGVTVLAWEKSATASHRVCTAISLTISALFVLLAAAYQVWALNVRQEEFLQAAAARGAAAGGDLYTMEEGIDIVDESGEFHFNLAEFVGWPAHDPLKNIVGGTVLGLIFGFLDNFGLFYGMGALDAVFYWMGSLICAGVMSRFRKPDTKGVKAQATLKQIASDMHVVTSDLMAGLGNTFSDFLGVALGTAALEIAKAGLGVEPTFWPLDLISMVMGCLLGVFLPCLIKHKELLGGPKYHGLIAGFAWSQIALLFLAVFLAGVPYDWGFKLSSLCLVLVSAALFLGVPFFLCRGGPLMLQAGKAVANEIGAATKPRP